MAANTSGLFGASGYNLLNPRKLDNPFGAGGYFALNPFSGSGGTDGSGSDSAQHPPTITIGDGKPTPIDYAAAIENDPAFAMLKKTLSGQGIYDATHLRGAIQQALIQFGAVPPLPDDVQKNVGILDDSVPSLAANNPFSVLKGLQQKFQDQNDAAKNQLAARGILSSGETGYQLGLLGQQQAQGQYDLTNSLLGNIGTLNDQYVSGRQAAQQQLAQGAFSAESNAVANGPVQGSTVTASWDPATGTYKDANGSFYDPSGNPISMPAAPSPPPPAPQATSSNLQTSIQQLAPGQRPLPGHAYGA